MSQVPDDLIREVAGRMETFYKYDPALAGTHTMYLAGRLRGCLPPSLPDIALKGWRGRLVYKLAALLYVLDRSDVT